MRKMRKGKRKPLNKRMLKENLQLGALTLPVVILLLIFSYWPMFGIIIAFKNYKATKGIFGSPWCEPLFKNFDFFFKSQNAWRVIRNTLGLNALFIVVGVACALIFALILFEVKKSWHVKIYQTVSILPNFLSWVAVSYIVYTLLEPQKGILNRIITALGGEAVGWYSEPALWPAILVLVKTWHSVGMSCIIYYAALMGIDQELFEAAEMDGAGKLQRILHISLPHLVPIITIMTILNIGGIFRGDFGLFYNVTRDIGILYPTTDIMDTYVYRALIQVGDIGMSGAATFIQSVVCFVTLMVTNTVVKKFQPENALF